jgi:hypothetical protein
MRLNFIMFIRGLAAVAMILFLAGCAKDENVAPQNQSIDERGSTTTGIPPSTLLYAISDRNELVKLMSGPPATEIGRVPIFGLRDGDRLLAIDIRPATRQIYGVSAYNLIYTIDANLGFAQLVSQSPFSPGIEGTLVGFDFDQRADRIRLVTEKGQNIRISPTTGAVTNVDFPINPSSAAVNGIAYSYSTSFISASALYAIGITEGKLYLQNPLGGTLTPVGSLGLIVGSEGGFDISRNNTAFAILFAGDRGGSIGTIDNTEQTYRLYTINLRTGQATSMGKVRNLIGLAIP